MYSNIAPSRCILGGLIVALPLAFINNENWRWGYVVLILVMYLVFNSNGLGTFANFINREL